MNINCDSTSAFAKSKKIEKFKKIPDFNNIKKISCDNFSVALNQNGEIFIWGYNPLGDYEIPTKVKHGDIQFKNITSKGDYVIGLDRKGIV